MQATRSRRSVFICILRRSTRARRLTRRLEWRVLWGWLSGATTDVARRRPTFIGPHNSGDEKSVSSVSVGISLKELGVGADVEVFEIFAHGLKFTADFHLKMSVCRHELGVEPPNPRQFQPWVQSIPTRPTQDEARLINVCFGLQTLYKLCRFFPLHHTGCQHALGGFTLTASDGSRGANPTMPRPSSSTNWCSHNRGTKLCHISTDVVRHVKQNYVIVNAFGPILCNRLLHNIKF